MKNIYTAGTYLIKCQGRGVQSVYLNKGQAKLMFDLIAENKLELESIQLQKDKHGTPFNQSN